MKKVLLVATIAAFTGLCGSSSFAIDLPPPPPPPPVDPPDLDPPFTGWYAGCLFINGQIQYCIER